MGELIRKQTVLNMIDNLQLREANATKEQREQLDLMRAKAQMNIKPIRKDLREMPSADAVGERIDNA